MDIKELRKPLYKDFGFKRNKGKGSIRYERYKAYEGEVQGYIDIDLIGKTMNFRIENQADVGIIGELVPIKDEKDALMFIIPLLKKIKGE